VVWAIDTPERTAGEGVEGPVFVGVDSEGGGALDFGRLTVSVADGRVFCLEGLASEPALGEWRGVPMGNRLTCRDAADGKQLWAVGVGAPAPPADCGLPAESLRMLAAAEFASAPAVDGDRLLVLAEYAETYHAVCLDARTGRPVWTRLLSSAPEAGDGARHPTAGSPPAVADGAAFFLTNAGVLAALDAAGGEPIWMMQYEERGVGRRRTGFPSAPLIAGGVVYALPTDAEHVLAVRADTGEAVWRDAPSRRGQGGLVGLTGGVLVLGGPDVRFVRAADGAVLGGAKAGMERTGRPALTRAAVYVPVEHRHGSRGVVRVSLPVGGTAPQLRDLRIDPRQQTGMQLGHLVVADGRLIAAGEDQLHAFFDLEEELRRLTAELAGDPENRQILLDRGGLSLSAGRLDAAEPDLTSARRLASAAGDRAVEAQARAGLFDLHFARADAADDPASRRRHLEAAREAGTDPVRTATVLLEMARAAFDAGSPADLAEAADRAQEIIAAADVRIDPADRAERRSRSSLAPVAAVSAHLKAHALVGGVIAAGGRKVYERHDRAADQALTSAAAAGDIPAMDEVLRSYPHGLHARRCRLELGMAWARRALAEHRKAVAIDDSVARLKAMEKVAETGHKALDHLRTIDASTADAHRPTALFVLTDLYIRVFATPKAARSFVRELSQLDAGTPIAWEDPAAPRRLGDLLPGLRRKVGIRDDDD
jgi:outer membrane protein assembly factor BamB